MSGGNSHNGRCEKSNRAAHLSVSVFMCMCVCVGVKWRVGAQPPDPWGVNSIVHWGDVDSQDICFGECQSKKAAPSNASLSLSVLVL